MTRAHLRLAFAASVDLRINTLDSLATLAQTGFIRIDWQFNAEQPASAPHMLSIVPHTVPRVGRSYEHFPDGSELHLLRGFVQKYYPDRAADPGPSEFNFSRLN